MERNSSRLLELFYCYAHKDRTLRDELAKHLAGLHRSALINSWYDGEILPGTSWEQAIERHISTAHIILLLVSPDFIFSDYCYSKEMVYAIERHHTKEACVIPVLLRPVDWSNTPFSQLQMLPSDARPITSWPNRDKALEDVAKGIRRVVDEFLRRETTYSEHAERQIVAAAAPVVPPASSCLTFKIYRLENHEFLFSAAPWPFTPHPDGEDIKSKFTPRSERNQIIPRWGFSSQYPTIAATKLVINFYLINTGSSVIYLEKLFLRVTAWFAVSEKMFWNTWMPMIDPYEFEVRITPDRIFHVIDFGGRLVEIPPGNAEHFRVKVMGEKMKSSQICEFELGTIFHDLKNESRELISERNYHIAFRIDGQ